MIRAASLLIVAVVLALAGACADDGADSAPASTSDVPEADFVDATGESTVTVEARDNVFVPEYVTVSPGTEVVFDNTGRNPHNAIAVDEGAFEDVTTDQLQPGDTATVVFEDPGSYPYYCSLHGTTTRGMVGEIRVVEP
jgi:plastocyanin